MRKRIKAAVVLPVMFLVLITACNRPAIYDKVKEVSQPWLSNEKVSFVVDITDSLSPFNFYITVRNHVDYRYANLFLFLETRFPDGRVARDTINLWLADAAGNWLGKGMGEFRDSQILYRKRGRFPMTGRYRFEFEQAMRTPRLEGIKALGIRIEKLNQ